VKEKYPIGIISLEPHDQQPDEKGKKEPHSKE
jgi:hypothetical protein